MMDLDWLRAAIKAETECGFDIQIGGGRMPERRPVDPIKLKEQLDRVRIYSLLFGELKRLLHEVDFGSGFEAAYTQGRRLIIERIQALSLQDATLLQLLADSATLAQPELQARLRQQLHALLDESDWQQITTTALSALESKMRVQISA